MTYSLPVCSLCIRHLSLVLPFRRLPHLFVILSPYCILYYCKGLVNSYGDGGGGGYTTGGGASEVLPLQKSGGGGAVRVLAMLKGGGGGGHKQLRGRNAE